MNNTENRRKEIVQILINEGEVTVEELKNYFKISESTIRRDLNSLYRYTDLKIKRIHGGAILESGKGNVEPVYHMKINKLRNEKIGIAQKALEMISENETIILDSGTTLFYLAQLLPKIGSLKVVALDLKIAEELSNFSNIETHIIGGEIRPGYYSIGGPLSEIFLKNFYANKVFLSADAVHPNFGVSNASLFEVGVKKMLVNLGSKIILLADHTKLGKYFFFKVCEMNDIDILITSKGVPDSTIEEIKNKVKEVYIV